MTRTTHPVALQAATPTYGYASLTANAAPGMTRQNELAGSRQPTMSCHCNCGCDCYVTGG